MAKFGSFILIFIFLFLLPDSQAFWPKNNGAAKKDPSDHSSTTATILLPSQEPGREATTLDHDHVDSDPGRRSHDVAGSVPLTSFSFHQHSKPGHHHHCQYNSRHGKQNVFPDYRFPSGWVGVYHTRHILPRPMNMKNTWQSKHAKRPHNDLLHRHHGMRQTDGGSDAEHHLPQNHDSEHHLPQNHAEVKSTQKEDRKHFFKIRKFMGHF
ncbi:hypothetical protein SAY86_000486 [Trapa natans]|uniref:Uncharacterized protein n=1 Tax=Trapa natans TaxID=22666 RepID=A0AAN7N1I6_TRANT|nr:hypothetical protein SAY86_000486 [Trapa natans]